MICVLGSLLAPQEAAAAPAAAVSASAMSGAPTARPWRSVSAPRTTLALLDYAMQPPGDTEGGGEGDTIRPPKEPNLPAEGEQPKNQQQPPPTPPPAFSLPDTARHGDSIRSFPGGNPAALETLGPGSMNRPNSGTPAASTPHVHERGGILGLHPIALLVGLIALHIFIVTKVVK